MSQTSVHLATPGDLVGILALYRELRPTDAELPQADMVLSRILSNPDIALVVCECDGTLAATCMLAIVPNLASGGHPFGVIEHVVTLAQFRRRGFARAVLVFALKLAWARNCYKVILLSGTQRSEAHALYEGVGFRGDVERGFVAIPGRRGLVKIVLGDASKVEDARPRPTQWKFGP
jgi:GNAT superfamily N-acetyltransferase